MREFGRRIFNANVCFDGSEWGVGSLSNILNSKWAGPSKTNSTQAWVICWTRLKDQYIPTRNMRM